eukprot:PITA_20211
MVNDVWEVVSRPQDRSVVGSRWIYKIKYVANGSVEKYKARFVAKGYAQKEWIDYEETFTSIARLIEDCKKNLATEFNMKDLGQMHYFLRLEVWQQKGEIFLGQGRYAIEILKRFGIGDCRPMATPMITNWKKVDASEDKDVDPTLYWQLIGSLMYVVNTRPDICYVVNTLNQFMVELKRAHWVTTKHVLRYLQGTVDYGLLYTKDRDIRLSGFNDADWAGSSVDRKSTSGYYFNIGSGMTFWCSSKQKFVALSSCEAEYMAASTTSCEAIWLRKLLVNLFKRNMEVTKIMCDNQSFIKLSEILVFHDRSKHIDIWCHFVRDCVQQGDVQLSYTPLGEQVVDILTKALGKSKFDYFRENMGMVKNPFQK